ncbi:MAG: hypothetical protein RIN56_13835 [Sporomusaceae bacterium]|nr:hypothetical protein [Sporomusaceae bacterium]
MAFIAREWKFLLIVSILIAALGTGWHEWRLWRDGRGITAAGPQLNVSTDGKPSQPGEPQVVFVQGQGTHTREIVYVPKESDPATGEKEKTDVQFDRRQGKIFVKVNGKDYEIPAEVQESTKFEKGKLVITEETQMRVNITAPKPRFNLGLGMSVHGPAAIVSGPLKGSMSWWLYGDRKTIAGGIQIPIMR